MNELEVKVSGCKVGSLEPLSNDRCRFVPDGAWLRGGQMPVLSLSFLSDDRPRVAHRTLPNWFENLLPERDTLLRRWLCQQHGLDESDSIGLISVLGQDLPGAVQVIGHASAPTRASKTEPVGELFHFSLTGVQLKLSMVRGARGFTLPASTVDGDWIVKIPGREYAGLPRVESVTMAWASAMGLPTPENRVVSSDEIVGVKLGDYGGEAYAIRRFDREGTRRVHQEDLAQALDVSPLHKYGDGPIGVSYDGLAKFILDAAGANAQASFIRRLAFVVASGNGDAHLKNWSFQWQKESLTPTLSPCYDQVATITWARDFGWSLPKGPALALSIGREKKFRDLSRNHLATFERRGEVEQGVETFCEALLEARAAWASVEHEAPTSMREAIQKHWRRVPLLVSLGGLP